VAADVTSDATNIFDFNDPIVKFKQDQTYACSNFKTKAELEANCKSPGIKAEIKSK
jgi:hypothetical protein